VTTAASAGSGFDRADAVAVQPDGKIVAAGRAEAAGGDDFAVLRYTPSGGLDTSFDLDGKFVHAIGPSTLYDAIEAVAAVNGKIVAAGSSSDASEGLDFAVARYFQNDADSDARPDSGDNCPTTPNPDQADVDRDGLGNACDPVDNGIPSAGNDKLIGTNAGETICGLAGNDQILGLGGDDTLFGDGCGVKTKLAAAAKKPKGGNDKLFGGDGNDRLFGDGGNDLVDGGKGKDLLVGGRGKDRYRGGAGNDRIKAVDRKKDKVDCGKGKKDRATVDRKDKVKGCEKVKRKGKPKKG
jgi:uncharacterized delta-60 repeat protein